MLLLRTAVREERWDVVALCLLWGCLEVASLMPRDAVVGILEAREDGSPA